MGGCGRASGYHVGKVDVWHHSPLSTTTLAVHNNSPAFKACPMDRVDCHESADVGKSK